MSKTSKHIHDFKPSSTLKTGDTVLITEFCKGCQKLKEKTVAADKVKKPEIPAYAGGETVLRS